MEFKVSKTELVKELALMQGIVERRTTIPILSNFLVSAENDALSFLSTDLELTLKHSCPADVKEPGALALPTRAVYDIVRILPNTELTFRTGSDAGRIYLDCQRAKYKIASLPADDFPKVKDIKTYPVTLKADHLRKVFNHILFAISSEESRFPVTGALFALTPDSLLFVSTDGHRLSRVEITDRTSGVKSPINTIVPRKALVEMKKIIDLEECEEVSFAVQENHAFFKLGNRELVTRLLEAEFPKYEKVIPKGNDKIFVFQKEEIEQAIRHVAAISSDKSQGVRLEFSQGKVLVSNSAPELGEAKDELTTSYDGETFEIGFNIQYLLDFFTHCDSDRVVLELKDQSAAGLLRPEGEEDYRFQYVVMPMKI